METILIVDDEDQILRIYKTRLEQEGFKVLTAKDGEESIRIAKEGKPDLIIMDVKMPVMNGAEAALKIKEDPETKNIRLVFLSAFSDLDQEVDRNLAKQIGALDYLVKGSNLDELVGKVKALLA